ncbi:high mobility group box domain-containing protein [Earliella scabrosa]|nr:high mobility group box domain-containing protein [Earliella scabrosa]
MEMIEQAPPTAHSPAPTTESDPDEGSSSEKPKIKRPQNAFMLFRGDWHRAFKAAPQNQDVVLKQAELSRLASRAWAAVDDETRERYQQRAAEEKLAHRRKYPEYKYQPGPQKYSKGVRIAPYAPRKKRQPKKEPKWYEREEIYVGPQGAWTSNEVALCSVGGLYSGVERTVEDPAPTARIQNEYTTGRTGGEMQTTQPSDWQDPIQVHIHDDGSDGQWHSPDPDVDLNYAGAGVVDNVPLNPGQTLHEMEEMYLELQQD